MKTLSLKGMKTGVQVLCFLICVVVTLAGTMAHAQTYTCPRGDKDEAVCEVDERAIQDNFVYVICQDGKDQPPVQKTCSAVYTPIQGYTYTGMQGRNWICESNLAITNDEYINKRLVCSLLCGKCDPGWGSKPDGP